MATFNIVEKKLSSYTRDIKKMLLSCEVETDEETIIIPNEVEILHPDCFKGLTSVKQLIFSENITNISASWEEEDGFTRFHPVHLKDLKSLEYIDIKNVNRIESGPFFDCKKLKVIKSNKKIEKGFLDDYSLLHCFSLKEINCDESDIEHALGDVELFDYPLLNKNLEVARMKIDFNFSRVLNQTDYIKSWNANFDKRTVNEIILYGDNREPRFVICDEISSCKNLEEFLFVWHDLWETIINLGGFSGIEWSFPTVAFEEETSFKELIEKVEERFNVKIKDLKSPRKEIKSLEDALYFINIESFFLKSMNFKDALYALEPGEEKTHKAEELVEMLRNHLKVMINYYEGVHKEKEIAELNAVLGTSSNWLVFLTAPERKDDIGNYENIFYQIAEGCPIEDMEFEIAREGSLYLFDKLASQMGHPSINFEKYELLSLANINSCECSCYYSASFNGDLSCAYVIDSMEVKETKFCSDLFYEMQYEMNGRPNNSQEMIIYLNLLLKNDVNGLNTIKKNDFDERWNETNMQPLLVKENQNQTLKSEYSWFPCGLKDGRIDYLRLLTDYIYAMELVRDETICLNYPIAFDVENIILSHDFESFIILYNLAKKPEKVDKLNPNNFYFEDMAICLDNTSRAISVLSKEAFNTIINVKDK